MDIESSRLLIKTVFNEYPELLNEFLPAINKISKETMVIKSFRIPKRIVTRADELAVSSNRKQAEIIREALEIGLIKLSNDKSKSLEEVLS